MNKQQQKMVEENHNLIYSYINSHKLDFEEYYDLLAIQLCKCAVHWDVSRGSKFSTFVYYCFDNVIKDDFRKKSADRRIPEECMISIETPIGVGDTGKELTLAHTLISPGNVEDDLLISDIQIFLKSLPPVKQKIFDLHLQGYNQTTIGKIVNKPQPQIHRIIESIQVLLRKEFKNG